MHTTLTHTQLSICGDSLAGWLLPGISITASFPPLWSDASSASLLYLSPSLFSTFWFSTSLCSLSLLPLLFFALLVSSLFFLLKCPQCMYHISHTLPPFLPHLHLSLTLACFHCLSPSVSLSRCRVRSGNSLFVMFSLNISSPFPEEFFFLLFMPKNRSVSSSWAIDEHGTASVCN